METLQNINEIQHNELLTLLNPLVDFMTENGFSFFMVAGKDGTCTRHMRGQLSDVAGMIRGMMENNDCVREMIEHCN